jgi:CRP/FNR family transcriptional regulator, nitrogen fixation regulation protein
MTATLCSRPQSAPKMANDNPDCLYGLSPLVDSARRVSAYRRNQEIHGGDEGAEYWYCLLSGAARKYLLLADGRRRIVDFLMPGDYFGFRGRHQEFLAAEAIAPGTNVASYPRHRLETIADSDPQLGRRVREIAFESISRSQARILILGRVTALEKVRAFLDEMKQRSFDQSDGTVVLPMSRYDIADYLAISVETVSRALSELKRRGNIKPASTRRIRFMNPTPLMARAGDRTDRFGGRDGTKVN